MTKHLVYKTTNLVNGKYYIGVHSCNCRNCTYLGSGTVLKAAIIKHGRDNFKRETLKQFKTSKEAYNYEKSLVDKDNPKTYNVSEGGKGGSKIIGRPVSQNTRKKMSLSNTGKGLEKARKASVKTNSKPILIHNKYFDSHSQAARVLGLPRTTVTRRVNSKNFNYVAVETLTVDSWHS